MLKTKQSAHTQKADKKTQQPQTRTPATTTTTAQPTTLPRALAQRCLQHCWPAEDLHRHPKAQVHPARRGIRTSIPQTGYVSLL